MIVLNLDADGRVLSAGRYAAPPKDAAIVEDEALPQGNLNDYLYVDGEFVYDPLPEENEAHAPTAEERIAALEAQNEMLTECLLEMSAMIYA